MVGAMCVLRGSGCQPRALARAGGARVVVDGHGRVGCVRIAGLR